MAGMLQCCKVKYLSNLVSQSVAISDRMLSPLSLCQCKSQLASSADMALSPCLPVTLSLADLLSHPIDDVCESEKLKLAVSEGSDGHPATDHTIDFQRRVEKRRKVVEGILVRYEGKLPVEFLTFLLPNPEEHLPKRQWERKMSQARNAFLIMTSVCSALDMDSINE